MSFINSSEQTALTNSKFLTAHFSKNPVEDLSFAKASYIQINELVTADRPPWVERYFQSLAPGFHVHHRALHVPAIRCLVFSKFVTFAEPFLVR